jgi:hypothetical protein
MSITKAITKKQCCCGSTLFSIREGEYDEGWGLIFDEYTCKKCGLNYILARCPCGCYEEFYKKEINSPSLKQGFMSSFFYVYDPDQMKNGG